MDELSIPLGLHVTEEVPVRHIQVDLSELDEYKNAGETPEKKSLPVSGAFPNLRARFDVYNELSRIRLSRGAMRFLREPVESIRSSLKRVQDCDEEHAQELLMHIPTLLDYYPEELLATEMDHVFLRKSDSHRDEDISCDSVYRQKKNENVEAGTTSTPPEASGPVSAVEPLPSPPAGGPVVETALIKANAEGGISVAHSPCAYDLSGSVPWANYTTDGYKPLSVYEVRYHRVHICSPNVDRPLSSWKVTEPKDAGGSVTPQPDGSCPFRTSAQLSFRDISGDLILLESIEQFPLLMHFHGMSGSLIRYHSGSSQPPKGQGHTIKLESEYLPRVYGGNAIKLEGSSCTIFESSLLRAPVVAHKPSKTDFLLVRSSGNPRAPPSCVLHPIKHLYVVGQAEPLYRVDVPVGPRLHQSLSVRVAFECRRYWLKAKQMPNAEFVQRMFIGERKSLVNRYLADSIREIQQKPSQALVAPVTPEEACAINAMKEGVRRLAERGIERIFAISPMRIRNYVRDIEVFERSMPAASRTPRNAHLCAQLENEMRLSTWNLTNDYWDVLTGKRGAMFQFSPLGDPSGGRGEGISFRKILKSESTSSAAALSSIAGSRSATMEIDEIRSKSKKELVVELQKLNVPDRVWKTMSRWQLMRQLALLLGIEDDSEERLAPWKRKALHAEKIAEAWKKQMKALSDPHPPEASHEELVKAVQAYKQYGLTDSTLSGNTTPLETPVDSDSEGDQMIESLLQDIQAEPSGETAPGGSSEKPKITRLEIVSTGRTKSTGNPWTQVTYVYGKRNIALYRKWKELEEEGKPTDGGVGDLAVPSVAGGIQPGSWQEKVEMTLKVHRRFQRMIKQAAEAGRPIPDCKRCGACHLFGHDQTFEGCPVLIMDMGAVPSVATAKRKRNIEQSPVYD
jgi:hypothetical protein